MQLNTDLIIKHISKSRSLAFFVKAKTIYVNSTIYNYTHKKLADSIGLSESCVKRHIYTLRKIGLVRYHGKNLTFVSSRGKHLSTINNKDIKSSSLTEIVKLIRLKIFERAYIQQKYVLDRLDPGLINNLKTLKRNKRFVANYDKGEINWKSIVYSDAKLADMFSCSVQSVQNWKVWASNSGKLSYRSYRKKITTKNSISVKPFMNVIRTPFGPLYVSPTFYNLHTYTS